MILVGGGDFYGMLNFGGNVGRMMIFVGVVVDTIRSMVDFLDGRFSSPDEWLRQALRVLPAETRLTVYRRRLVRKRFWASLDLENDW